MWHLVHNPINNSANTFGFRINYYFCRDSRRKQIADCRRALYYLDTGKKGPLSQMDQSNSTESAGLLVSSVSSPKNKLMGVGMLFEGSDVKTLIAKHEIKVNTKHLP
jgi:hypothetical protein